MGYEAKEIPPTRMHQTLDHYQFWRYKNAFHPAHQPPYTCALHQHLCLGLGPCVAIFRRHPLTRATKHQLLIPHPTTARQGDTNATFGIITCATILPYFLSSYMQIEEN